MKTHPINFGQAKTSVLLHHTNFIFRSTLCILLLLGSFSTFAETPISYTPKLQKVTVYIQGAHLYYNENVNLQAGNNEIVFENISPFLVESSLQASSKGAVVILRNSSRLLWRRAAGVRCTKWRKQDRPRLLSCQGKQKLRENRIPLISFCVDGQTHLYPLPLPQSDLYPWGEAAVLRRAGPRALPGAVCLRRKRQWPWAVWQSSFSRCSSSQIGLLSKCDKWDEEALLPVPACSAGNSLAADAARRAHAS